LLCPEEPEAALRAFAMPRIVAEENDGVNEWKWDCEDIHELPPSGMGRKKGIEMGAFSRKL
jgi:hypothetical protein